MKIKADWNQFVEFWHKVHIWSEQYRNPQATEEPRAGGTEGRLSNQSQFLQGFWEFYGNEKPWISTQ